MVSSYNGNRKARGPLGVISQLYDGQAYRIQGYISFLPEKRSTSRGDVYPPPPERLWAMPMVVVQGYYRGRLEVAEVSRASDANPMQAIEMSQKLVCLKRTGYLLSGSSRLETTAYTSSKAPLRLKYP